jgi:RNA polymerase sigma-70 factor (ECF subfamily)
MPEVDEERLVALAKDDPQAFGALYDLYVGRIYAYIYRQARDDAQTKDVVATTFEKALRNIHRYEWQGKSFCAWLYRIARNELIQQHRKQRDWGVLLRTQPATEGRGPEAAVQTHERRNELQQALAKLSDRDREIITLRFYEDLSSEEVAEVLDCSIDNVYVRLHRALKRLRTHVETLDSRVEVIDHVLEG